MKIAYLCDISPDHVNPYSGGNARIFRALSDHAEVTVLPQGWGMAEPVHRAIYGLSDAAQLRLRWRAHLALARIIAAPLNRMIAEGDFDVVFGAYSFQSLSRIAAGPHHARQNPRAPLMVYTSDATPTVYKQSRIGKAFGSSPVTRLLIDPLTLRAEHRIFSSLDLMLCPSPWLRDRAQALYDLAPGVAHVLPWGANVDDPGVSVAPPPLAPGAPLNLLVIGRDWVAKGGPVAFETMQTLRTRGVDARLTVIGATPPALHGNENVTLLGPLDKGRPEEERLFHRTLASAHFLIQPSFESYGFAFCEAAAYGLPSLCLDIGGVPVRDGVTGHPLPADAAPSDFTDVVMRHLADPAGYAALRASSRTTFESSLNWDAWAKSAIALMASRLKRPAAR